MSQLLVDGSGLVCRHWWGHAGDVAARFRGTVAAIAERYEAKATIAWDRTPTWRHELFPGYKANRPPKPEALVHALEGCKRMRGFRHLDAEGYEADDIIATLARGATDRVLILSSDKDFCQLVSQSCFMVNDQGIIIGPADVTKRWGVPPAAMRLLISWMGDSSDGLPGVRGIGPKRAIPHALAGEVGDPLSYELAELATVPQSKFTIRTSG